MGELDEAVGLAARVGELLEAGGIEYLIGGSVVTGAYGEPRATNDLAEFGRKVRIEPSPGSAFYASSVDDNLLWKLRWFRMGGEVSDQQWRDVLGLVRISGAALEREYLRFWARHHGVEDLLDRLFEQATLR